MPLPQLTWNTIPDRIISASAWNYQTFLNRIEEHINASTHWRVNSKVIDGPNARGFIEIAAKSNLPTIRDARFMILANENNSPMGSADVVAPAICMGIWAQTVTTAPFSRIAIGFSPDAASTESGPVQNPWTSATPYGAGKMWSRVAPLHGVPGEIARLHLIESAEVFNLNWIASNSENLNGVVFGNWLERKDGETADCGMWTWKVTQPNATHSAALAPEGTEAGWFEVPTAEKSAPLQSPFFSGSLQPATYSAPLAVVFRDGYLHAVGQMVYASLSFSGGTVTYGGYAGSDGAMLQAFPVCGSIYAGSISDENMGILRQIRRGPPGIRGERFLSSGVEQAICMNYAGAPTGRKPGALWFDHFRGSL
jgi:hypothetical protein